MWLKLTRDDGSKELFNMSLVVNIAVCDDDTSLTELFFISASDVTEWQTIAVRESVDELAAVLGAVGKT